MAYNKMLADKFNEEHKAIVWTGSVDEEKVHRISSLISDTSLGVDEIKEIIAGNTFNQGELSLFAADVIDGHYMDMLGDYEREILDDSSLYDNWLYNAISVLLELGFAPNLDYEGLLVLDSFFFMPDCCNPNKALRLLLENNADPNLYDSSSNGNNYSALMGFLDYHLFDYVGEGSILICKQSLKYILLLAAYGGCAYTGDNYIDMTQGRGITIFKDIDKFDFEIINPHRLEDLPERHIKIFEIDTGEEVARYRY